MMISRRPATANDTEFLWKVQRLTLGEYVSAQFGTTESQQRQYFDEYFDVSKHSIVLADGEAIGFLFFETRGDHIFLGNIAILPSHQSQAIGTDLIRETLEEAAASGLPVRLQVLKPNVRAQALYERLGFSKTGESASHVLMTWSSE